MDKVLLEKLARALLDKEETEKTAEMDKVAELQASYELGQYTAEAFIDEFNKIASLMNTQDETEKIAAVYEDYGRAMARDYFASLMAKEAEGEECKEEKKEEAKEEKKEEAKEEKKEEAKEEAKEEKKADLQKKASAKDRLVAALKQLKK